MTTCLLCGRKAELQHSHVLPTFVFRWLRESSGNGFLRETRNPNLRSQDGQKRYWLCGECEQLFGGWEKTFADRIFHPYLRASGGHFDYASWLSKFAASVSWRVLHWNIEADGLKSLDDDVRVRARAAEQAWRDYLLGVRRRPGNFSCTCYPSIELNEVSRHRWVLT